MRHEVVSELYAGKYRKNEEKHQVENQLCEKCHIYVCMIRFYAAFSDSKLKDVAPARLSNRAEALKPA